MNTVALIPARGGSVRVPRKNLALVGGVSLVARAVSCAAQVQDVDAIYVCTEDAEIAAEASRAGARACPRELNIAGEYTRMEKVVDHFIAEQRLEDSDRIVLLEPPATFRSPYDVRAALRYLDANPEASGVRSVTRVEDPPYFLHTITLGFMRPLVPGVYIEGFRPSVFRDNGLVNVIRVGSFKRERVLMSPHIIGMEIEGEDHGLDIDTPADLLRAQQLAHARRRMQEANDFT